MIKLISSGNATTNEIMKHAETGMVGIVSAFRAYLSPAENNKRTADLEQLVLGAGFDYQEVSGNFREAGNSKPSRERTLVIYNSAAPTDTAINSFRALMKGFAAKFQQDSLFILYGKSTIENDHPNTTFVGDWGTSDNAKTYRYGNSTPEGEIDYSDYTYKNSPKQRSGKRVNLEGGYDIVGELWERDVDYGLDDDEKINEVVSRSDYRTLKRFSHVTLREAFAAYTETMDGTFSIFSSAVSKIGRQARVFSGSSSRALLSANRKRLLSSTLL